MAAKIFINYRRDDARADARNVRDRLAGVLGPHNIFMDVDDLRPGQQFDSELKKALLQCDVFLAVIGRRWLELLRARDALGERDFVRDEIVAALARGIIVIPVLVDTATLPRPDELPADIRDLVFRQKHDLTHERFGRDVVDLVSAIKARRNAARRASPGGRYRFPILGVVGALTAGLVVLVSLSSEKLRPFWPLQWIDVQKTPDAPLSPGKIFRDCPDCPEMVVVPAGQFMMGSPETETGHASSESPQHRVQIAKAFAVGKYEVTVKEYEEFVTSTGGVADRGGCEVWTAYGHRFESDRSYKTPSFSQLQTNPVVCVSWQAATTYTNWLTTKTAKKYRLLSEAEWEYAARAGSAAPYFFGDDEAKLCSYGNGADRTSAFLWGNHLCSDSVGVQTAAVGAYQPNAFGLYDMVGNVWEWVQDCMHPIYDIAPTDGSAWMTGDCKQLVVRGGSWDNAPKDLRSATRGAHPLQAKDNIGFRVAREID